MAENVLTRREVEQILSGERIPEDRRVFYALLFLAALRFGETAAGRWRDYEPDATPLGLLCVATAMHAVDKREKGVKTEWPCEMTVHPTLARVLAAWNLKGGHAFFGRLPGSDDLIVPSRKGNPRSVAHMLKKFHGGLERLGLRPRRQQDARRTFISRSRADGARPNVLRWVTHGPTSSVVDAYTALPWYAPCAAVACLKIQLKAGELVPMRLAAGTEARVLTLLHDPSTTVQPQTRRVKREGPKLDSFWPSWMAGSGGLEPLASGVTIHASGRAGGRERSQFLANARDLAVALGTASYHSLTFAAGLVRPWYGTPRSRLGASCYSLCGKSRALRVNGATIYHGVANGTIPHVRVGHALRVPVRPTR